MREIAVMAWRHTSRRQGRTTLTVLGIAIGFGAIIAILSLSYGVKRSVEEGFDAIATDAIVIPIPREVYETATEGGRGPGQGLNRPEQGVAQLPGGARTRIEAGYIDQNSLDEMIAIPGVTGYVARSSTILIQTRITTPRGGERLVQMPAMAIDPAAEEALGQIVVESGRWPGYLEGLAGQALQRIGGFSPGEALTVTSEAGEEYELTISGLAGMNREARFGGTPNVPIFIGFETVGLFTNVTRYSAVVLQTGSRGEAKEVADLLQASNPNITALTYDDFTETIESTLNQYSLFLLSIGVLAVAVAALGSANTMVVSTMERTREIGIMKATGAKSGFIMKGFLIESALLGLVGGVVGVVFGYIGSHVLEYMVFRLNLGRLAQAAAGFEPYIPLWLIPFSVLLAVAVTVISGSYPAVRASKLDPVEAIRYE